MFDNYFHDNQAHPKSGKPATTSPSPNYRTGPHQPPGQHQHILDHKPKPHRNSLALPKRQRLPKRRRRENPRLLAHTPIRVHHRRHPRRRGNHHRPIRLNRQHAAHRQLLIRHIRKPKRRIIRRRRQNLRPPTHRLPARIIKRHLITRRHPHQHIPHPHRITRHTRLKIPSPIHLLGKQPKKTPQRHILPKRLQIPLIVKIPSPRPWIKHRHGIPQPHLIPSNRPNQHRSTCRSHRLRHHIRRLGIIKRAHIRRILRPHHHIHRLRPRQLLRLRHMIR